MIKEWFQNNYFIYIIGGICAVGILFRFILSMKYRLLIRASKRMGTSKNKLMRVLRLKFETCYKLKIGVNNVDTFVDKYVYRHRFCGLYLYTWETISGEFIVVSVLSASVFSVFGMIYKCGQNDILYTFASGILSAIVLIGYDYMINLRMKRNVLKVNIKDYLENFLKSRLESAEFSSDLLEQYRKEYFDLPNNKSKKNDKHQKKEKKSKEKLQPALVAHVETAASEDTVEKETKPVQVQKTEAVEKVEKVGKVAKEDPATLRREAKKNELKKMIEADKASRSKQETANIERIPYEKMVHKQEVETKNIMEEPEQEIAASKQPVKEVQSEPVKVVETKEASVLEKYNISSEEAKIIEDILKEYLA